MGTGVGMTAEDIIISDDWRILNVLITKAGWMKVKGERLIPIDGALNYASAWGETGFLCELYKNKTGKEIHQFAFTKIER